MPIDLERFRVEYRRSVDDVLRFVTPERQHVIARHNPGLAPGRTDLRTYLTASEIRYRRAVRFFNAHLEVTDAEVRALDVGGFLGAYPLTLARLGLRVALAEVYSYYGGALDDLSRLLASEGVEVLDIDFTGAVDEAVPQFTMVTNMAMLEHLPGSPGQLMANLRWTTADEGALVVEVPNIAYWPKRWDLFCGRSVHPPLDAVMESATPFLGHHREYTVRELNDLLTWTGFRVVAIDQFNYSFTFRGARLMDRMNMATLRFAPALVFRNCRELILVLAVPAHDSGL